MADEKRYYITTDGRVVNEGDLDAAQQIFVSGEGQEMDEQRLKEWGADVPEQLKAVMSGKAPREKAPVEEAEAEEAEQKAEAGAEDKAVSSAPENKAQTTRGRG